MRFPVDEKWMEGPGVGKVDRGVILLKELYALDLLSGEMDVAVHAGQTNPETS